MKLLFTEVEPWECEQLQQAFQSDTVSCSAKQATPELVSHFPETEILSIFIICSV